MIDRNSQFMAILTNVGAAKLANANALGIPWNLTQLGVGDANGTDPMPSATQTKLINEQRRAPLNQLRVDPVNAAVIIAEQVIPADVGGWWIREIGLYDSDGDLVAVSNCAPSFKPALDQGSGRTQIVRMNFIVSSINNIVLKIDPAIVLATREYVDLAITEAINKQDFKHSVLVATTANIVLNGIQTVDGVLLATDTRVLVKDQTQVKDNGIYVVPANGAWKRAQDADASIEVTPGLFVSVEKGTANGDSVWQLVTDAPIVLGTTPLVFEVVAGRTGVAAGTYRSLTVDKLGRVIAGTNPTTLEGSGITDGATKTALADAIAGVVAKTGATMSGSITLSSGGEDSPEFGFKTPSTEAYLDLFNKNLRIFARSDGVDSTPLLLSLPTKSAYVFGSVIWNAANFDPAGKLGVGAGGWLSAPAIVAGPIAGVSSSQLFSAVSPSTTDTPPSYPNTVGMHMIFANTQFGADIAVSLNDNIGALLFRNLGPNSSGWRKVYHEGNFNPASKMNAMNCANAGFTDNTATTPFMTHSNGTTVALQVRKPNDTALLAVTGNTKNADTGEIIQWIEYSFEDMPSVRTINVTWPFQFPTQFINAKISIRKNTADPACLQAYYSAPTTAGCTVYVEEWSGVIQKGITIIVEARGS